jgi:hypothetical protein
MSPRGAVVTCAVAALLAGCGSNDEDPAAQEPETELTIIVTGGGTDERWSLTCGPVGGDHPDPEAACTALVEHADELRQVAGDVACTQIFGGPQRATVEGRVDDETYSGSFSRQNGCEIARWGALQPLLVVRGGA